LLIGVNDTTALKHLYLEYIEFNRDNTIKNREQKSNDQIHQIQNEFTEFIATNIESGRPVIAGFYEIQPIHKGDSDYDHIMPIVGISKDRKHIFH